MRDVQPGRIYRHFKGDYYLVEALARDSETNEPCVIYRKLYGDGGLWVRPLDMFLSPVDREKYPDAGQTYRFELQTIPSRAGHAPIIGVTGRSLSGWDRNSNRMPFSLNSRSNLMKEETSRLIREVSRVRIVLMP